MPTLEDILNLKKDKTSLDLVPMSNVNPITQEELDAMRDGINNLIENRGFNPTGLTRTDFIKDRTTGINPDAVSNDYLAQALKAPGMGSYTNSLLNATMKADNKLPSEKESVIKGDQSDFFARYDFPMYADNDDPVLAEQAGFAKQTNMDAIIKGAKNIVPVAIGVGAQMLGGTMQIANNLLGDDDYDNPITAWGKSYMEKHMSPIYQAGEGQTFSSPKSLIAAGSEILGQFGSAIGSMVGMQPVNSALLRASVGIGSALGGPIGAMVGTIAGTIAVAAMNAYAEGVIDAADVHDEKYAELIKKTGNERYSKDTAKLAASTVAGQDMILNTALNIIPVMWSTKPHGVDRYIKNALGLDDIDEKWFNLHKPYVPQKLASETLDEYEERLAKIVGSNYANNMKYSMTARPLEALQNIGQYVGQKKGALAYNFKHPIELLRRNWDIVGETIGEGLEEYHNYYAREQGMKVYGEEDAGWLPSIPTLMKGYSDMVTKGEGAYDLVAGAIIGGMTSPILSNVRYGRSKVFNPHTGQMEYKYDRNKLVDWIPFEFNKEFDKHDYNQYVINSLNTIRDSKELANSYLSTQDADDRQKILNQLLAAPLTNYVDNNAYEAYMLSMEAFSSRLSQLDFNQDENLAKGYLSPTDKTLYEGLLTQRNTLLSQTDPNSVTQLNSTNDSIKLLKDKAKQAASKHDQILKSRIHFLKETAEEYKKVKDEVESAYGNADYGYANTLFKNKMALELEKDILANAEQNYNAALTNLKNKIKADNPTANEVELMNKFEEIVEDGNPQYQDLINAWVATKKNKYASEFRLHRFSHRYNSLNSWGYENNDDLIKELELLEQISDFKFTDDEIKTLGEKDTVMKNISYYNTLLQQFRASHALETDPIKKQELQSTIDFLEQYINSDPSANAAYAKYLDFVTLSNELNNLYKKQVSNQKNFKGNEKAFVDFNPFRKYLQRNELLAKELKKMSQAKTDIDLIKTDILEPYEEYANIYEDSLLDDEKVNVFDKMLKEYDKLMYNKALKKFDSDDYRMYELWLGAHDLKFEEVLNKMKLAVTKYSTPGTENKTLVKYAKKMIEMMNYQKDVIDQLKLIQTQQTIQIVNSNVEETIDLLNKGIIDIDIAIANVQANSLINNDEKNAFLLALNNLKNGIDADNDFEHFYTQQLDYYYSTTDGSIAVNHSLKTTFSVKGTTISKNTEVLYKVTYGPNSGSIINDVSTYTKLAPNLDISTIGNIYDMNFLLEMSDYIEYNNPVKLPIDNDKAVEGLINYLTTKYPTNASSKDIEDDTQGFIDMLSGISTDPSILNTLLNDIYKNNIFDFIYLYLNKSFYSDVKINNLDINTINTNDVINIINDSLNKNSSIGIQTIHTTLNKHVQVQAAFKDYSKLIGNTVYYFIDIDNLTNAEKNQLKRILTVNNNESDILNAISNLKFSVSLNKVDPDDSKVTNIIYTYNTSNNTLNKQSDIVISITSPIYKDFVVIYDIDSYIKEKNVNSDEVTNIISIFSNNLKSELSLDDDQLKETTIADINNSSAHYNKKPKLRLQLLAIKLLNNGYYNPLLFFEFTKLYRQASNVIKSTIEFQQALYNIEKIYLSNTDGFNTYVHNNGLLYKINDKLVSDHILIAANHSINNKPSTIDISFIDSNIHIYNDKYVVKKENGIYNIYEIINDVETLLMPSLTNEEKERIINYLAFTYTKLETKPYVTNILVLPLGKISETDYEIRSDGVYFENIKIADEFDENIIGEHINKRQDAELAEFDVDPSSYHFLVGSRDIIDKYNSEKGFINAFLEEHDKKLGNTVDSKIIQSKGKIVNTIGNITYGQYSKSVTKGEKSEDALYVDIENGDFIVADGMGGESSELISIPETSVGLIKYLQGEGDSVGVNIKNFITYVNQKMTLPDAYFKAFGVLFDTEDSHIQNKYKVYFDLIKAKGTKDERYYRTGATSSRAKKIGDNKYKITKTGDATYFVVDKNGNIKASHGLSADSGTWGHMFFIKNGEFYITNPKFDEFEVTLEEGDTLVISTDFIETEKAVKDFIATDFGKNINFTKFTKNNKRDDATFVAIRYVQPVANQSITINDGIILPKPIIEHHDNKALFVTDGVVTYGTVKITNSQNNNATLYIDTELGNYGVGMSNNDKDDDKRIIKPYEMSTLVLKHLLSKEKPYTKFDEIIKLIAEGKSNNDIMILLNLPNSNDIIESIRNTQSTTKILGGYSFARGVVAKKIGINTYTLRKVGNSGFVILNSDGSIDKEIININTHSNSIIAEIDNNVASFNGTINDVNNNDGLSFNVTLNRDQKLVLIDGNFKNEADKNTFIQNLNSNNLSNHDNYGFIIINYDESELSIGEKFINSIERENEELNKELYNFSVDTDSGERIVINGHGDIDSRHDDIDTTSARITLLNINTKKLINKNKLILKIEKARLADKDNDKHNNEYIKHIEEKNLEKSDVLAVLDKLGLLTDELKVRIENIGKPIDEQEPIDVTENDNPIKEYTDKLSKYIADKKLIYTIIGTKLFPIIVSNYDPDTNQGNDINGTTRTFRKLSTDELLGYRNDLNFYIELTELNDDLLYDIYTKVYMMENLNQINLHINPIIAKLLINNLSDDKKLEFAETYLTEIKNTNGNFIAYVKLADETIRVYSTQDSNDNTKLIKDTKSNDFKYAINTNQKEIINAKSIASGKIRIYKGTIASFGSSKTGLSGKKESGKTKYNGKASLYIDKNGKTRKVIQYTIINDNNVININTTKSKSVVLLDELDIETGRYVNAGTMFTVFTKPDGTKSRTNPIKFQVIPPYFSLFLKNNQTFIKDFEEFIKDDTKFNMIDYLALVYNNNPNAITKSDLTDSAYNKLFELLDTYSMPHPDYKLNNFRINLLNAYLDFIYYNIVELNKTIKLFDKFIYDRDNKQLIIGDRNINTDYQIFITELENYINASTANMNIKEIFDWFKANGDVLIDDITPNIIDDDVDTTDDIINDSKFNDNVEKNKEDENVKLVLNTPNSVANSHREKSQLTTNYFSTYESIFGTVKVEPFEFNRRRDSLRKLLNGELIIPDESLSVFISLETTDNISVSKNGQNVTLQTKEDYKNILSDLFDMKYKNDKLKFLYDMGILELMYMADVTLDSDGTLNIVNSDRYIQLKNYTKASERYKHIIEHFNNNSINLDIAKQIYIISKTQFVVDTVNDNEHIGYVHDLEYLTNELRSVSLLGNNIFSLPNDELLDFEMEFITNGFRFLNKIYNQHQDNMKKSYVMNLNNYGKLNTVKKSMVSSLASFRQSDKVKFFQLSSERKTDGNHNFILKNFTAIGEDLHNLYDGENMDTITYIYNILAPSIGENWVDVLKRHIEIITNKDDLFTDDNTISTIIKLYENVLSDVQKSSIENTIITTRWKSVNADEKTIDFKSIMSIYMVNIKNPFQIDGEIIKEINGQVVTKKSNSNRFFNLGNTTLDRLLENFGENFDNAKSNDSIENNDITSYLNNIKKYMEGFKKLLISETKIILKNIENTDLSTKFIYEANQPATNITEKALLLRKIFKLVSIKYPTGDITSTKSIAVKLAESKMRTLGSFYLKYKDDTTGTMFIALKNGDKIEVLNVNNKKLYIYNIDSDKNVTLINENNKAIQLDDVEFDTKLDEMLPKIYLNISYTENKKLHINLQTSRLNVTNYFDLIKIITNTNINGISNHFFINPILSISDDNNSTVEKIKKDIVMNPSEPVSTQTFKDFFKSRFQKWTGADKYENLNIDTIEIEKAIKDFKNDDLDDNDIYHILISDLDEYILKIC